MIEKFFITPTKGDIEKFYIDPTEYPAFYITPTSPNAVYDEEEGGGGTASYSWQLYSNPQWNGAYANTSWTTAPGNYTGYGNIITVTNPSYTHAKVVAIAGANGYWRNGAGAYYGSMGVKTSYDYELIGSGSAQVNAAAAIADWLTGSVILKLGSDRKIAMGFNATPGTLTCIYSVYFGYEL